MTGMVLFLAATKALKPVLLWLGLLIVVVVAVGLVIFKLRGMLLAREADAAQQEGLLKGLRRMRDAGTLSKEEYDHAKRSMAARAAKDMARAGGSGQGGGVRPPARPAPSFQQPRAKAQERPGEVRAHPGFDLTGEPLPKPDQPSQGDG